MEYPNFIARFDALYAPRLLRRTESFRLIFSLLEDKKKDDYLIVETGCMREFENMEFDGMSTYLFDDFVRHKGGRVISIDISPENIKEAARYVSERVTFYRYDSVLALYHLWRQTPLPDPDFLYLDSFDLDPADPLPSALHHLKELAAVMPRLKPGTILCVDDNLVLDGKPIGKGKLVKEFLRDIGITPIYDGYQIVWQL